jgi:hypothetical protein
VPGMAICSAQTEGPSVVIEELYGDVLTFTVVISSTPTGPTQTVFTHSGSLYNTTTVNPPKAGTYFWRLCATNTSKFSVGVAYVFYVPFKEHVNQASTLQNGPMASMPPNGILCGVITGLPSGNRVGASTQVNTGVATPILWFDVDTDDNGDQLNGSSCTVSGSGQFDCSTTANLNDTVYEMDDGNVQFCAINTSSVVVQASMNIIGPGYVQ